MKAKQFSEFNPWQKSLSITGEYVHLPMSSMDVSHDSVLATEDIAPMADNKHLLPSDW